MVDCLFGIVVVYQRRHDVPRPRSSVLRCHCNHHQELRHEDDEILRELGLGDSELREQRWSVLGGSSERPRSLRVVNAPRDASGFVSVAVRANVPNLDPKPTWNVSQVVEIKRVDYR